MARPLLYPNWATNTVNNGANNSPNKVEPTTLKKSFGWDFPEKPPREEFNWWMNLVGEWVNYLDTVADGAGINTNFAYDSAGSSGFIFAIEAGTLFLGNNSPISVPAFNHDFSVTPSTTRVLYLDLTQSGTPASIVTEAATYPVVDYIPLFTINVGVAGIDSFVDDRTWAIQGGAGTSAVEPENEFFAGHVGASLSTSFKNLTDSNTWVYKDGARLDNPTDFSVNADGVTIDLVVVGAGEDYLVTKLTTLSTVFAETEEQVASEGQTDFLLIELADNKNVTVYVNGVFQGNNFTTVGTDTVRLSSAASNGDVVHIVKNANASSFIQDLFDVPYETHAAGSIEYDLPVGSNPASQSSIIVTVGNVLQPNSAFTWDSVAETISFGSAASDEVTIRVLGVSIPIGTPGSSTVGKSQLLDSERIPPGSVQAYVAATAPSGWLICDGQSYDSTTDTHLAELYTIIGTTFGGTGPTDFNVPDCRGEFIRGLDSAGVNVPTEAGRVLGDNQAEATNNLDEINSTSGGYYASGTHTIPKDGTASTRIKTENNNGSGSDTGLTFALTGDETRPRNIAMNYIIKY